MCLANILIWFSLGMGSYTVVLVTTRGGRSHQILVSFLSSQLVSMLRLITVTPPFVASTKSYFQTTMTLSQFIVLLVSTLRLFRWHVIIIYLIH